MRFFLFTLFSLTLLGSSFELLAEDPIKITDFRCYGISETGSFIAGVNSSADAVIYDMDGNCISKFSGFAFAEGNFISDDGMAIGADNSGLPVIMDREVSFTPASFLNTENSFGYKGSFNSISADGLTICGNLTSSPEGLVNPVGFVLYAEEGYESVHELPCPAKDLFDGKILYATAEVISSDGKVIYGRVVSSIENFSYPISYYINDEGNWEYSIPLENLFNPDKLEISEKPEDPNLRWPTEPFPEDYLDNQEYAAYDRDVERWFATHPNPTEEDWKTFPDATSYMSSDSRRKYEEAYNKWKEEYDAYREAYDKYYSDLLKYETTIASILSSSPSLDPKYCLRTDINGNWLFAGALRYSYYVNDFGEVVIENSPTTAIADIQNKTWRTLSDEKDASPSQIFENGEALAFLEENITLLVLNEDRDYSLAYPFFADSNSLFSDWYLTNEDKDGLLFSSADKEFIVLSINNNDSFSTFLFMDKEEDGVNLISDSGRETLLIYDLNGRFVCEFNSCDDIHNLPKGLYIINGTKTLIR